MRFKTYEDIAKLWEFNTRETQELEFKSEISTDNKEISKDISSFANTSGGYLIYGIKEESSVAIDSEGISLDKQEERINSVIETTIKPFLRVNIIIINSKDKNGQSIPNQGFIIIYIPISPLRPHMVTTIGKFYFRQSTSAFSHEAKATKDENKVYSAYKERIGEQQRQKSYFEETEDKLKKYSGGHPYLLLGVIPQIPIDNIINTNEEHFRSLLIKKDGTQNFLKYGHIYVHSSSPEYVKGGCILRSQDGEQLMMINDNLSLFFMYRLPTGKTKISETEYRTYVRLEKTHLDIIKNVMEIFKELLENNEFNSPFVYHIKLESVKALTLMGVDTRFSEEDLKEEFYLEIVENLEEEHEKILYRLGRSLNLPSLLQRFKNPTERFY